MTGNVNVNYPLGEKKPPGKSPHGINHLNSNNSENITNETTTMTAGDYKSNTINGGILIKNIPVEIKQPVKSPRKINQLNNKNSGNIRDRDGYPKELGVKIEYNAIPPVSAQVDAETGSIDAKKQKISRFSPFIQYGSESEGDW
jgi:hypothetical protein